MKKLLAVLLSIVMVMAFITLPATAAGLPAGHIYGTDIVTYINGAPVTSYNIGGVTCIDAEILNWHYGFDVYWFADTRELKITDKGGSFASGQAYNGELVDVKSKNIGEVLGNYYTTDIVTYLNGEKIESYNLGGRTIIVAEAMRNHGYNVEWNQQNRTLSISKPADFYKYETPLGTVKSIYNYNTYVNFAVEDTFRLNLSKARKSYVTEKPVKAFTNQTGTVCISFEDFAEIFGGEWKLKEKKEIKTSTAGQKEIEYEAYGYELEFNYNPQNTVKLEEYSNLTEKESVLEWKNTDGKLDVVAFDNIATIKVNGEEKYIKGQHGGNIFPSKIIMYNSTLYVPVQMVADILGYDVAFLNFKGM